MILVKSCILINNKDISKINTPERSPNLHACNPNLQIGQIILKSLHATTKVLKLSFVTNVPSSREALTRDWDYKRLIDGWTSAISTFPNTKIDEYDDSWAILESKIKIQPN